MFKVMSCDVRFFITLLKILLYFRELFPDFFLLGKGNKKKCEFIFFLALIHFYIWNQW